MADSSMLPSVSARTANRSSSFQSGNSSRREFRAGPYCDFSFFDSSSRTCDVDCNDDAGAGAVRLFLEECKEETCDFGFDGLCESDVEDIVRVCGTVKWMVISFFFYFRL